MAFSRKSLLTSTTAVSCLVAVLAGAPVQADNIPEHFFKEWTVAKNCTEQHAGLVAHVDTGLKFKVTRDRQAADGSYVFQAENIGQNRWAANWNGMKLQYRAGTEMKSVPADFECIPGQEASSPFLAMSNYAVATEPYYEQAHWYGLARIHGQLEHVLIFPRKASSGPAGIVVMQSVNSPDAMQLDQNGLIHIE